MAIALVATFLTFELDIHANQDTITTHEHTIELNRALSLGLLCVGLLISFLRRYQEQARRSLAGEHHVRELAFRGSLTGLANRRRFDEVLNAAIALQPAPRRFMR